MNKTKEWREETSGENGSVGLYADNNKASSHVCNSES